MWNEPASAEIEIGTLLFPWYEDWLWRHTEPGKTTLYKSNAIYGASNDARQSPPLGLGYGSHQTIRGYLKTLTNRLNGKYIERSDPGTGLKWIERSPKKEQLDDEVQRQVMRVGRQDFLKSLGN